MDSPAPKWTRKPDDRPIEIMEAALVVFGRRGFRAATMDEIAREAGISKGAVYLYFGGKEELFTAAIRHQFQEVVDLFPAIEFDPDDDPETFTQRLGHQFLKVLMKPRVTRTLPLVIAEYNHIPALKELYFEELLGRLDAHVASLIDAGKALGAVRPEVDSLVAARALMGMFFSFVLTQEVFDAKKMTPMDNQTIVNTITTVFFRGLLREESGPCADA
jgi:AcrR family transcriptional regulator